MNVPPGVITRCGGASVILASLFAYTSPSFSPPSRPGRVGKSHVHRSACCSPVERPSSSPFFSSGSAESIISGPALEAEEDLVSREMEVR